MAGNLRSFYIIMMRATYLPSWGRHRPDKTLFASKGWMSTGQGVSLRCSVPFRDTLSSVSTRELTTPYKFDTGWPSKEFSEKPRR